MISLRWMTRWNRDGSRVARSFALGNCVEVASLGGGMIGMRDSKSRQGMMLKFTTAEWQAFLGGIVDGEFDSLSGCRFPG